MICIGAESIPTPVSRPNSVGKLLARSASGSGGSQQRRDVASQMPGVAGAEQHHVHAGLVAREPIRRLGDVGGAAVVDEKAERLGCFRRATCRPCPSRERLRSAATTRSGLANMLRTANISSVPMPLLPRERKQRPARALVHHVEAPP